MTLSFAEALTQGLSCRVLFRFFEAACVDCSAGFAPVPTPQRWLPRSSRPILIDIQAGFSSKHGLDDMTLLAKVTEDGIVENLQKRYKADVIYVRCHSL